MVSIGTHRLHLYCRGSGSPTVILECGASQPALLWTLLPEEQRRASALEQIAQFTQVCSYDRAGYGWSDAGPMPRTLARMTEELHELLTEARVSGPYVMVGPSFGGLMARIFYARYPGEVAGIVFVDAMQPDAMLEASPQAEQWRRQQHRAVLFARFYSVLARLGAVRGYFWLLNRGLVHWPAEFAPDATTPPDVTQEYQEFWMRPEHSSALASQTEQSLEGARELLGQSSFADLPLVVMTAGTARPEDRAGNAARAKASTRGRHVLVSDSGHNIVRERPRAVADAVRRVVEQVRSSATAMVR